MVFAASFAVEGTYGSGTLCTHIRTSSKRHFVLLPGILWFATRGQAGSSLEHRHANTELPALPTHTFAGAVERRLVHLRYSTVLPRVVLDTLYALPHLAKNATPRPTSVLADYSASGGTDGLLLRLDLLHSRRAHAILRQLALFTCAITGNCSRAVTGIPLRLPPVLATGLPLPPCRCRLPVLVVEPWCGTIADTTCHHTVRNTFWLFATTPLLRCCYTTRRLPHWLPHIPLPGSFYLQLPPSLARRLGARAGKPRCVVTTCSVLFS